MPIVIFILILTFLVLIHELGHFITARLFKVQIEEFGIGMPPKVLTMFTWKGIPFTLNWMFIGGFVRMTGEDGEDPNGASAAESRKKKGKTHAFGPLYEKPAWQRLIIILAGATINFIYGIAAFAVIFSIVGIPVTLPRPVIAGVQENTPAAQAGIQEKDEILAVREGEQETQIQRDSQFIQYISERKGKDVTVVVKRGDETKEIPLRVRTQEEIPEGQGALGVVLTQTDVRRYPWYEMPLRATVVGVRQSVEFSQLILTSLGQMVTDLGKGKVSGDVAGPVGIAYQVNKENVFSGGILAILNFSAVLSINLAIMNVLPIPALDGGRAFFVLIERFFTKKTRLQIERAVNTAGFMFLIGLIILITLKDVWVIISEQL